MKLNSLLGIVCFGVFTSAIAGNVHIPTNMNTKDKPGIKQANASSGHPYCGIYIVNSTGRQMVASGVVDQYSVVDPFYVSIYEPAYIKLDNDFGYCQESMDNIKLYVSPYLPINTGYIQAGLRIEGYIDYYNNFRYQVTG